MKQAVSCFCFASADFGMPADFHLVIRLASQQVVGDGAHGKVSITRPAPSFTAVVSLIPAVAVRAPHSLPYIRVIRDP